MSMYGHGHSNLNVSGLSDLDVSHLNLSNHHNNNTNPFENSELYTKSGKLRKVKETKKTVKNEKGKGGKNGLSQGNNGNDGEYEYNYSGGYEEDEGLQGSNVVQCCFFGISPALQFYVAILSVDSWRDAFFESLSDHIILTFTLFYL